MRALRRRTRAPGPTALWILIAVLACLPAGLAAAVLLDVLRPPLPYPAADRLIAISNTNAALGQTRRPLSWPDAVELARTVSGLAALAAYGTVYANAPDLGGSIAIRTVSFRGQLFAVLGNRPVAGRVQTGEEVASGALVAVISHRLARQLGVDAQAAIGDLLNLDGRIVTVIGVMPPEFYWPDRATDLWMPASADFAITRGSRVWSVVARLDGLAAPPEVASRVITISGRLAAAHPETNAHWTAVAEPLSRMLRPWADALLPIVALAGAAAVWSLTTAAAALGAVSALSRRHEIATLDATGAPPASMTAGAMFEAGAIAIPGAAIATGIVLASRARWPPAVLQPGAWSLVALSLAAGVCFMAVFVTSDWLTRRRSRARNTSRTPDGVARSSRRRSGTTWLRLVAAAQLVFAVQIGTSAVAVHRAIDRATTAAFGFDHEHLAVISVSARGAGRGYGAELLSLFDTMIQRVTRIPGVVNAAASTSTPFNELGVLIQNPYRAKRHDGVPESELPRAIVRFVSDGYLSAMGTRLLRGTGFERGAAVTAPIVINETLQRRAFGGEDPIGRSLLVSVDGWDAYTIVGVSEDTVNNFTDAPMEEILVPLGELPVFWPMNIVVRTAGDPGAPLEALRREIVRVEPRTPPHRVATMTQLIRSRLEGATQATPWLSISASCAALLSFGVLVTGVRALVTSQGAEMATRAALGATPAAVARQLLRDGVRWSAPAMIVAAAASLGTRLLVRGLLPEAQVAVTGLGMLVAVAAALVAAAYLLALPRLWAVMRPGSEKGHGRIQ